MASVPSRTVAVRENRSVATVSPARRMTNVPLSVDWASRAAGMTSAAIRPGRYQLGGSMAAG